jgi:hypothetical protein
MNKIILAFVCGAAIFFESCSGCKENNPPLDFGGKSIADTTYVLATVPLAQTHNVLVEEFTGQSCSNCPTAHEALETEVINSGHHVNVIGLYIYGPIQGKPVAGSVHDFRDSTAYQINSVFYEGKNSLPSGGVDRVPVGGSRSLAQTQWSGAIANRLAVPSDMNIEITTLPDLVTNLDTIIVKVTYTKQVDIPQNLSIAIVEDSMIDKQEKGLTHIDEYDFVNVFRGLVTPAPNGSELNMTAKAPGTVFQKVYVYKPKNKTPAIILKNCRVIAFVHSPGPTDYQVFQSMQAPLRP